MMNKLIDLMYLNSKSAWFVYNRLSYREWEGMRKKENMIYISLFR